MIVFEGPGGSGSPPRGAAGTPAGQDVVVLGLPRGGVPVASEVAAASTAPLDVIVVRKLGVPFQPELAMGAIGEDGVRVLDRGLVAAPGRPGRRSTPSSGASGRRPRSAGRRRFRRGRPRVDLHGRVAVIVDDGIATGSTAPRRVRGRPPPRRRPGRARGAGRPGGTTPRMLARRRGRLRARRPLVPGGRAALPRLLADHRRRGGGAARRGAGGASPAPTRLGAGRDADVEIPPGEVVPARAPPPARRRRGASWSSRTAAAAAGTARATGTSPRPARGRPRHPADRPAHPARRRRIAQRLRHRRCSPARSSGGGHWLRRSAETARLPDRLLRRQHRRRGGAVAAAASRDSGRARSSRAAAGRTWPATGCARVRRRRC